MKRLFFGIMFTLLIVAPSRTPEAKVTGECSNCHTMHNSQGGAPMAYDFNGASFSTTTTPKGNLLIYSCLGCHSATDGTTWKDSTTGAPIVFNTVEPTYNTVKGLAAGNFYWVKTDDTKGHNVFSDNPDDNLSVAPGDSGFSGCATNDCHTNFHATVSGSGFSQLDGKQGCTKCHMVDTAGPKGFHHANDGTGTKYVGSADQGWYRFLEGHMSGDGHGVAGVEDDDWEHIPSSDDHNEYLGFHDVDGGYGFGDLGHTMTAYCTGCHGVFHDNQGGPSPWLRHPSDARLPSSGEYANYTTYDPLVPVARPSLDGTVSATVTPGTDMVMCLSCHRAHGSPYYKMMRWDYASTTLSTALSGCNVCHTSKD